MIFKNREEAAKLLAVQLRPLYYGKNPLVLAIPRGAVPMATIIAKELKGEMDVVLVRKLGAPNQSELAIGAVDENGEVHLNELATILGISPEYILEEKKAQLRLLDKRRALYRQVKHHINPTDRIVIIIDDGIATGATMAAALGVIRAKNPTKLIAVTAVAAPDALERINKLADEVVCLDSPRFFSSVGEFYLDFPQVSDDEVLEFLKKQ